jgi:hypothetical protein
MATNPTAQRLVSGRYALVETIGKGGMGVVWRARDTILERVVAIKEIALPTAIPVTERDALRARVNREARGAARLTHPSAVTIYDVVEDEGTSYIVMEMVDAPTLADLVKRNGPLAPEQAAVIGLDVLAALEKAHGAGIVHRDVKPGNVMVPPDGRAKLGDFGIASIKGDPKITTTGMIMGSPSFMAPEQATGAPLSPEVDLWSLGATLYYAVEGRPPFDKGQAIPTLTAVVHEDIRPPARAGALTPVLYSLMAKAPADRPPPDTVRAMLNDVVSGAGREVASATVPVGHAPGAAGAAAAGSARPTETWEAGTEWHEDEGYPSDAYEGEGRPGRGWLLGAAGLIALALLGGLALLLTAGDEEAGRPPGREVARGGDEEPGRAGGGGGAPPTEEPSPAATSTPSPSPTPTASPTPAEDTTSFTIGDTGFAIDRPADWTEVPQPTDADSVDFRDPETGTYLRVDWTDTPGDDAAEAWRDLERGFRQRHDNYRRIRIEEVDFKDFEEAALWEFTWTSDGTQLHAYDLGVVTNDGDDGFALNFVTREENWEASQPQWRSFLKSFRPAD